MLSTVSHTTAVCLALTLLVASTLAEHPEADGERPFGHSTAGSSHVSEIIMNAGAPDAGHAQHLWTLRSRVVDVDTAALRQAIDDPASLPRISLALFDDLTIPVEISRVTRHEPNRTTYTGVVPRAVGSHATISVSNEVVYGVVGVPGVGVFEIRDLLKNSVLRR